MSNKRKWTFRILAVVLGLSTFIVFEGVCRVVGWGRVPPPTSAFAEFAAVRPLFELDQKGNVWRIAENRRAYFAEESFPAEKRPKTFRIFVFGGSTVQGRPFSISTSFPTFLQIALRTAQPDKHWEIVNCGGISYASYRLLPIMQECLQYQPDLYIVCTGHNEFLECITYNEVRQSPAFVKHSYSWLHNSHSFRLAAQTLQPTSPAIDSSTKSSGTLPAEVDAMLDHQGGLAVYSRAALNTDEVVPGFRDNLHDMVTLAKTADIPLLLMQPPSNLRDCPPFKSEFSDGISDATQEAILTTLRSTNQNNSNTTGDDVFQLKTVAAKDECFAISWYQLGQALLQKLRFDEAQAALIRARDEDVCPLRMTSALEASLQTVAMESNTPLLNTHQLLMAESRNGIVGDAVLVDHVHPSFRSNQEIAIALTHLMSELDITVAPDVKWEDAAREAFAQQLQSLENLYFLRGQRTLKSLSEWTQGRADGPPLTTGKK